MFQRHEYHRERDDGNSKYYVSENDRNRSSGNGDDRANYNYKTSYNQDRDGNFYAGNRDYSRDGGNVEFSRSSTVVRDDDQYRGACNKGGAVYAGSVYSPYGQDANRYSSSYSSNSDNRGRNQDNQYSSGSGAYAGGAAVSSSYGGNQLYSQSRNYDSQSRNDNDNRYSSDYNRSSGISSQPMYYKQETKTYYNDESQRPSSRYQSNVQDRDNDNSSSRGYASVNYDGNRSQGQYGITRY